jgi:hypothetical protein
VLSACPLICPLTHAQLLEAELFSRGKKLSEAYERSVEALRKDHGVHAAFMSALGVVEEVAPPCAAAARRCARSLSFPSRRSPPLHRRSPSAPAVLRRHAAPAMRELRSEGGSLDAEAHMLGAADASDAVKVKELLLVRLTNASAGEYRRMLVALTGVQRDEGSLAIRTRLKVEQLKTASTDASTTSVAALNAAAHLSQPEPVVHQLLCIVASERPDELSNLTAALMQRVLRACVSSDTSLDGKLLKDKGVKKSDLQAALIKALAACPDGFSRYSLVREVLKSTK